jgi:hypothetical protein
MHAAPKPPRPPCPVHSGYCSPTPPRSPCLPPSCSPSRATGTGGACLYAIPDEPRFIMRPPRLPRPGHPGSCSPTPPRPTRLPPSCSPSRATGMGGACLYAIPDEPRFIMRPPRLPRPGHPGSCSPTPPRPTRLPPPCSPSRAAGMGAATSRRKKAHLTCVHRNAFKE